MLPRFQQDDECLTRHRGGRARTGGLAGYRAIRRGECHLVLGRLVQGHRDEPRLGGHRPLSPEDLHRPPDLACVQGIERMADPGRVVPVSGGRAAVILVPCMLARYHWRSLPRADAASAGGSAQVYHDMVNLRIGRSGSPGRIMTASSGLRRPRDLGHSIATNSSIVSGLRRQDHTQGQRLTTSPDLPLRAQIYPYQLRALLFCRRVSHAYLDHASEDVGGPVGRLLV